MKHKTSTRILKAMFKAIIIVCSAFLLYCGMKLAVKDAIQEMYIESVKQQIEHGGHY